MILVKAMFIKKGVSYSRERKQFGTLCQMIPWKQKAYICPRSTQDNCFGHH